MSEGQRYSEEEVALILKRAAELQQFSPHAGDSRSMSLAEVERVAEEAGVGAALVRQAAREVAIQKRDPQRSNAFLGGPRQIQIVLEIPGEFPVDRFDRIVEVIRNEVDQIGQVSTVGRSVTWTGTSMGNVPSMASISVSVRDGHTRIRLNRKLDQMAGAIFGGLLGGFGGGFSPLAAIGLGAVGGPLAGLAGVVGLLGLVYGGCRKIYASKSAAIEAESQRVVDELARVIKLQIDDADAEARGASSSPALGPASS